MRVILLSILIFFSHQIYSQKKFEFHQKDKTLVKIKVINDFEKLEITTSKKNKIQVIDNIETSITDKETNLEIEDYNFDGYKDFAVYHLDDGMGVYTIYQIFIYNPTDDLFKELKMPLNYNPVCDEFCDVQINKKKKTLQSGCRGGAEWHTDIWKFDKNKNLVLVKK